LTTKHDNETITNQHFQQEIYPLEKRKKTEQRAKRTIYNNNVKYHQNAGNPDYID
jgi:hypothetical protein